MGCTRDDHNGRSSGPELLEGTMDYSNATRTLLFLLAVGKARTDYVVTTSLLTALELGGTCLGCVRSLGARRDNQFF